MKTIAFLTLLLAGTTAFAAGPPVKKPVTSYLHLSQNSPFTTKPVVTAEHREDTTFEDWALGGVSEVEGGYMVTLVNKKNQGETQVIKPRGTVHSTKDEMKWINPGAPGSFKVDKVEFGKKSWKDTIVMVSVGDKKGTMKFDDKQMAPTAAAAAPGGNRPPGQPGQPGQPQPGQQVPQVQQPGQPVLPPNPAVVAPQQQGGGNNQQGNRPPRQRVLPPAPNSSGRQNR
ncbi:hypothetical protein [Luteolibacter soli]|uniref:Uncharacterized protein n=1 Tax=Luteolibacter soli TaxID=3135280 RepID=A0ABU9AS39_9BACT